MNSLVLRNRFDDFEDLFAIRNIDSLFPIANKLFYEEEFNPKFDIYENADKVTVRAEVPSMSKEDLKVEIDKGFITIKGEKKETKDKARYKESSDGSFERKFHIGDNLKYSTAKAEVKDGVLTVEIERAEEAKPELIPVT